MSLGDADLLVCVRRDDPRLNTHFRKLDRPGAIAVAGERIAVAGRGEIWVYERSAEGLAALPAEPVHDACFVPRSRTLVGDLGDPSLEYAGETLWVAAPSPRCSRSAGRVSRWRSAGDRPGRMPSAALPDSPSSPASRPSRPCTATGRPAAP